MPRVLYSEAVKGSQSETPAPDATSEQAISESGVSMRRMRSTPCSANTRSIRKRESEEWPSDTKLSPAEIRRVQPLLARQAMAARQHGDVGRGRHALGLDRGMLERGLGEAEIALALGHCRDDGVRDETGHAEVELGALGGELAGEARQEAVGERGQGGDAQEPGAPRAQLRRRLGDAIESDEGALDLGIERERVAGRHEPRAAALEQGEAEILLEVADHAADRGLADVEEIGGRANAAGQDEGAKSLDLTGIQASHL